MEDTNLTTPVIQNSQTNWLLFLLVGIVILGVGITVGLLVGKYVYSPKIVQIPIPIVSASPTPVSIADPTANWKIYTNTKYGFSFKYPQEYIVKTSGEITGATSFIVFVYPDSKLDQLLLTFNFDQSKIDTLKSNGGVKTEKPSEMPNIILETTNYPITKYLFEEGLPGYGSCMISNSSIKYVANINNKLVVAVYKQKETTCNPDGTQNVTKETTKKEMTTANQILSTFKFLDQKGTSANTNPTIDIPTPNSKITSPVKISGHVPRDWTFEANFIIEIQNQNRIPLSSTPVNATFLSETDPTGSFSVNLNYFAEPETKNGYLIIKNDNASGLPEKNKSFEVPVTF